MRRAISGGDPSLLRASAVKPGRRPSPDPAVQMRLDGEEDTFTTDVTARPVIDSADFLPHVTTSLLADLAGISTQAVRKWVDQGCPQLARNRFALGEVWAWERQRRSDRSSGNLELKAEELRERIEGKRIENAKARGDLIAKSAHEAVLQELATFYQSETRAAAAKVAATPEEREISERLSRRILERIAGRLERLANRRAGGGADTEAAAAPKRRRVGRPAKIATR